MPSDAAWSPVAKGVFVRVRYGLVYPGVGWIVWRNRSCVDESLIFHVNYLGTDQPSLNLNFSKNANMIVAQYYQVGSHTISHTPSCSRECFLVYAWSCALLTSYNVGGDIVQRSYCK